MFVRSALRSVCRRSSSNKFEVYDRGGKGIGRGARPSLCRDTAAGLVLSHPLHTIPTLGAGCSFFDECLLRVWAPTDRRDAGHLSWEGPKVTISEAFHKQTAMPKQTAELNERPLRTTRVFLAWSEPSHSEMGHLRSGMGLSSPNWAYQAQAESDLARDCHSGPVMGHVKFGVDSFNTGIGFSQAWDGPSSA